MFLLAVISWCLTFSYADITDIRLVNGIGLYDGRVEVLVNGTWGAICSTFFSSPEAGAICNIIFGTTYSSYSWVSSSEYGPRTGPIHIDKLDCYTGFETDINECSYSLDVLCTDHSRDAEVACDGQYLNITATRLVNGTGPYDGRIELYANGYWGTICSRDIDTFDAQTICSTHNASLSLTAHFTKPVYGKGTGPVLIGDIACYRHRDHINECRIDSPYRPYCTHDYDLSIVCTTCGLPKIYNGEVFSFNNTELTVKCQEGFYPDYIKMLCTDNGAWMEVQRCTPIHAYPLNISQIRLSSSIHEGRVELLVNGIWGTVCGTGFDSTDAAVLCRMLDLEYEDLFINANYFGSGSGTIFVNNLYCSGTEKHINNCRYEMSNSCTHNDDVGVKCKGYQPNITNIRLAGTNGPYHGRIEIEMNGTWGTVCDRFLFWNERRVFCRMLGLDYDTFDKPSPGSGPIYLDSIDCPHSASHINDCTYETNNYNNCDHDDDASVRCYGPRLNITDARLVNGPGPYGGRAEIKVSGTWGTICDDNFNIVDAEYFCRKLGLRAVMFYTGAFYGKGSGPVFIDQLSCKRNVDDLSGCKYLFLNECTHERDVSVVCNECGKVDFFNSNWYDGFLSYHGTTFSADCSYYKPDKKRYLGLLKLTCNSDLQIWQLEEECQAYSYPLNITDIRLANGTRPSEGRVEIKSLNTWGTICDDHFGTSEANVICRMVGYTRALRFVTSAFYGEGKGPIFADDLDCKENAIDLNDCTYTTYGDCSHENDISVVCTGCGDATPEHGFVNTSSTTNQTVVHVTCSEGYKLIGEEYIICQANLTWSNRPVCELIDCGDATLKYGFVNTSSTYYKSVARVTCDKDYKLIGEENIICQHNATWSNRPVCKPIDCGDPTPVHGSSNSSVTTNGTIALTECEPGYTMIGKSIRICQPDGAWTGNSSCVKKDCGDAKLKYGFVNASSTHYQSVGRVTCDKDYKLIGEENIICQHNATWSNLPVCKLIDCGDPTPVHGSSNSSVTTNGTIALIECEPGYTMIGKSIRICQPDGAWTGNSSCVKKDCGDPTPVHGSSNSSFTTYGTVALIECESGYTMIGKSIINCQQDGTWTETPSCVINGSAVKETKIITDGAVDGDKSNAIVIPAVCIGLAVAVAIIGIVMVKVFWKRTLNSNTVQGSKVAAGIATEPYHENDNPTYIQQSSTKMGSETDLSGSFREVGGRKYGEVDGQSIRRNLNGDNPSNVYKTSIESGTETNLRGSIREVDGRQYSEVEGQQICMKQLDNVTLTRKEHDQKLDLTMQTNETYFC